MNNFNRSIAIVTSIPLNEPVIRNRIFPFIEKLQENGFKVRLICLENNFLSENLIKNIHTEKIKVNYKKTKNFVSRFFKESMIALKLLKQAKLSQDEIIFITIPSMFLSFFAPLYIKDRDILLDVRDLTWEYLSSNSKFQHYTKLFFRFLFKKSTPYFKVISVTNKTELKYISNIYPKDKIVLVSNGVRLNQFQELIEVSPSTENKFTVTYIGNIGLAQNLETLIDAAKILPKIQFRIVGTGVEFNKIKSLIHQHSLKNIELTGPVSWNQVIHYYNTTHVLYAQLTPNFSGAMPSKLYEYLATGKYIIYGGQGQARQSLKDFENCQVIKPCNPKLLANAILEAKMSFKESYISSKNKEIIKNNYIRETQVDKFIKKIL